ncbi:putative pentatricopeptide repeat-containing protein At5g06400, mitochondrial isoform X1 [Macadamia integrifolia]|uniref:putative pentatricopeptide repeat-containing protein At5g06400, mitochondrial isoform X1 n=2 Tax=Macadamia integrifolia TaxID=60698 RepID=UPI001C4EB545|nr:putative pentatricopeptide repeat-containing protein At5g06400, mitochondrial isoform X1 [Macadamia integrifolia]
MRYLFKLPSYEFHRFKLHHFHLSIHSQSSRLRPSAKTQETHTRRPDKEAKDIGPLFREFKEIIGNENLVAEKTPSGTSVSRDTHLSKLKVRDEYPPSTEHVCEKAAEGMRLENENPGVSDVSPIVHKITEVVRAENQTISMEERLENSGFLYDPEIVEKVLKRCFKVRGLALRFFNWVKHRAGFNHTTGTYNTMIFIAGEGKEFDLVEKLVEEMEKNLCHKDVKTWSILISHYGKAKMIGKALLVFEKMKKSVSEPDERAYKLIISSLSAVGKADIAMELYKEMVHKEMVVDLKLYQQLLNCLSRSGNVSSVRSVGDDMIKIYQFPEHTVYSHMLKSFCISGRIREALELIHELKSRNITVDTGSLQILVKGLCRADRIADALEIADIIKKNNVVHGKVYEIIISGYLRKNDISKALELFTSVKESGHLPAVTTYTELMQHLFQSNEYQRACELYDDMLENGVEPDSVAIMAVVAGHVRHSHVSQAWEVFRSMKEKGFKISQKSYSVFIEELCRVSRADEAFKLLNDMWDSKLNIGDGIFHLVITCLEKGGELEKVKILKQMQTTFRLQEGELAALTLNNQSHSGGSNSNYDLSDSTELGQNVNSNQVQSGKTEVHLVQLPPVVYNSHDLHKICGILSSSMDWCLMQDALEKCAVQFTPELVVEILRNCQRHGYAALQFFRWVGLRPGYNHTAETYNMSIKISGCAKDFKHMRNLYLEMRRRDCLITSETWTIMIMQYGRAGLTEIALQKFKEMKADGFQPSGSTFKYLIICLCGRKGRKVDEAIKTFSEMICAGFMPDKELFEICLDCLCEMGKLSDARRLTESLRKDGLTIPIYDSLLIRALCRARRLEDALALVDERGQGQSTLYRYIFGSIIHGLLREGRLDDAFLKVEELKQLSIYPTVHVYTSFIVYFFKEKQMARALEIFKKMVDDGCEPTIVTYSALIRGYMDMGMVSDAWSVFRRMTLKGPFPDFKTYSMFINCLCKVSRSEEALQLIHEMMDKGIFPSTVNFRIVFHGLNREGKQDLAQSVSKTKWVLKSKRKFLT